MNSTLQLLVDNIFTIFFGITTIIFSIWTIKLKRKENQAVLKRLIDVGGAASLLTSREAVVERLASHYDKAKNGDVVWGQCVNCASYTEAIKSKVLDAAGRNVKFEIIANDKSLSFEEFASLYRVISNAELKSYNGSELRVQGLSKKEVVIAFRTINSYTGIVVTDKYFIEIIYNWFKNRFTSL